MTKPRINYFLYSWIIIIYEFYSLFFLQISIYTALATAPVGIIFPMLFVKAVSVVAGPEHEMRKLQTLYLKPLKEETKSYELGEGKKKESRNQ